MSAAQVTPYGKQEKKKEVEQMFDNIAGKYDVLNHFFSLGIDHIWRKKSVKRLGLTGKEHILDVATGTGDFAVCSAKHGAAKVTGLDLSPGMLEKGKEKMKKKGLAERVIMEVGDSENLRFEDNTFDGLTVGFGVRNFQDLEAGLKEMARVTKVGGTATILEFSKPKSFPHKQLFHIYSRHIIPFLGKLVSKDKRAYSYLHESVQVFPEGDDFVAVMEKCGWKHVESKRLSGGIATIYVGNKIA